MVARVKAPINKVTRVSIQELAKALDIISGSVSEILKSFILATARSVIGGSLKKGLFKKHCSGSLMLVILVAWMS